MLNWPWRKQPEPQTCDKNPGKGVVLHAEFKRGSDSWAQDVHVVDCLADALKSIGHGFSKKRSWIKHGTGLILQPRIVEYQPLDDGGVRTVTTIECSCPGVIPGGLFEYQHSRADTLGQAITQGFDEWLQFDYFAFHDALLQKPKYCTCVQMEMPLVENAPPKKRRVIFGNAGHRVELPAEGEPEQHAFCPCCFFTHLRKLLEPKLKTNGVYGVRFLALRKQNGELGADCRINGLDWTEGKQALIEYASTWPPRGFEMRKQYIIIQDQPQT